MHEAGIAQNILEISIATAEKNSASKINKIHLKVGKLAAIENGSLLFAFEALKEETMASEANLEIDNIPVRGLCHDCDTEDTYNEMFFACSKCSSYRVEILSGEELEISEIEVD